MTPKQKEQFNRMLHTLTLIANGFETPKQLRKSAEKTTGLPYEEVLEMAYENIQQAAKLAAKAVRQVA